MNFEINGLPSFGPISHLVGRAVPYFGQNKLDPTEVLKIRRMYHEDKMRVCDIARELGLSRPTISTIINNRTWKVVGEDLL